MLTNLVRELDDHDLSVLHTRNTQNGLVGVACVNPLHKTISLPAEQNLYLRRSHMRPESYHDKLRTFRREFERILGAFKSALKTHLFREAFMTLL